MRVATFNMRSGGSLAHWEAIQEAATPDLLCVQEAKSPALLRRSLFDDRDWSRATWQAVSHGRWGSGVHVTNGEVTPIPVEGFDGWVVGGEWMSPTGPVLVWSVHLPPVDGSYLKCANQVLDALRPLAGSAPMILAGDWKLTVGVRQPDEPLQNRPGELQLLDRLREKFGLVSAWQAVHPEDWLPQTLRWARDPTPPYHCDGLFLPQEWCSRIRSAEVLTGEPWLSLSDHFPFVVELAGEETEEQ